ncbi:MAG: hypothetical protein DLM57_07305 [Pseudonocardiales bacterium]|nr:MAG: hypothetical protein DLM57_07305 [Pseudonocardiales bacterium]
MMAVQPEPIVVGAVAAGWGVGVRGVGWPGARVFGASGLPGMPSCTVAPGGGVNRKLSAEGLLNVTWENETSMAAALLPRGYTCTPRGIFVDPSMAMRTLPTRVALSRGVNTSS